MPTKRKGLEICLKNTTTGLFWFSQMVTMSVCYPTIFQDSGHIILYLVWASSSTEFCSHQNSVKGLVTNVAQREQSYFWPKNGRKQTSCRSFAGILSSWWRSQVVQFIRIQQVIHLQETKNLVHIFIPAVNLGSLSSLSYIFSLLLISFYVYIEKLLKCSLFILFFFLLLWENITNSFRLFFNTTRKEWKETIT